MRFAVGVVLYNPDATALLNVNSYIESFDDVYVYDNTENVESYLYADLDSCVQYERNGRNMGLAYAYNHFVNRAATNNVDYLCTMDQDSVFSSRDIKIIKNYIYCHDMKHVGIVAPWVVWQGNENERDSCNEKEEEWVISSGSFINLYEIGNITFDENYFIDRIDRDYCMQLRENGKKIIMISEAKLYQQLGDNVFKKHAVHSPIRHYYICRNRLYYNAKFSKYCSRFASNIAQTAKQTVLVLLYEPQKLFKLRMIWFAILDYINRKMGKIDSQRISNRIHK